MLHIGCHLSASKGYLAMGREALSIGADAFRRIVSHPALKALPFLLETPNDLSGYATEIRLLREWAE